MLLGIISDVHANKYGLKAVLDALQQHQVDAIICAGDIVGYYPFVNETISLLKENHVSCILGNHDAMLIGALDFSPQQQHQYKSDLTAAVIEPSNLEWVKNLPISLHLELENRRIEIYHGSPWEPLIEYIYPDYAHFELFKEMSTDFVVLGHTHRPLLRHIDNVTVINPGSCGQPRDGLPGASYAILNMTNGALELKRAEYDVSRLVKELQQLEYDDKLIQILLRAKQEH